MVSGPPCPQCGSPLRWFPDQNAWGCDRCRQMFPAQQQQQMQQPPQMHGQMPMQQMPMGAPRPGGGKGKWIALGGLVAVGAIIAIVVATRGGGNDNDLDKLWMIQLERANDAVCACQNDECVRTAMAELDKWHTQVADKMKLTSDEEKKQHELLDKIGECAKTMPGKDAAPTDPAKLADAMLRDARQLRDHVCACKDAACVSGLVKDIDAFSKRYMPALDKFSPGVQSTVNDIMQVQAQCLAAISKGTAVPGPAQPAQPAQAAGSAEPEGDQPPEECAQWKNEIDRMHLCKEFPKSRAAAFEKAYLQMAQGWKKMDIEAVASQCRVGAESVSDAVSPVCPE